MRRCRLLKKNLSKYFRTLNFFLPFSEHTEEVSALQKAHDFIRAFLMGFEVQVCVCMRVCVCVCAFACFLLLCLLPAPPPSPKILPCHPLGEACFYVHNVCT
jgi:hypothetical protein